MCRGFLQRQDLFPQHRSRSLCLCGTEPSGCNHCRWVAALSWESAGHRATELCIMLHQHGFSVCPVSGAQEGKAATAGFMRTAENRIPSKLKAGKDLLGYQALVPHITNGLIYTYYITLSVIWSSSVSADPAADRDWGLHCSTDFKYTLILTWSYIWYCFFVLALSGAGSLLHEPAHHSLSQVAMSSSRCHSIMCTNFGYSVSLRDHISICSMALVFPYLC